MMSKIKKVAIVLIWVFVPSIYACKKFVDVTRPVDKVNATAVFADNAKAAAAVSSIYSSMNNEDPVNSFFTIGLGMLSDEFTQINTSNYYVPDIYKNSLSTGTPDYAWANLYKYIYQCNAAIAGIESSSTLTPSVAKQLLGESHFMRAFCYFYLVNLYGKVPLITSPDAISNKDAKRASEVLVYQQITTDLKNAQDNLSKEFLDAGVSGVSTDRVRPTYWAASALLARVYLYLHNWVDSEKAATTVLNNRTTFDTVSVANVFLKNSREAIWQLYPDASSPAVKLATLLIIKPIGGYIYSPVSVSPSLINSFDMPQDRRYSLWINSVTAAGVTYPYANKYQNGSLTAGQQPVEYLTVLRVGEQYLIRAEARVQQGDLAGGTADLNVIYRRAGLTELIASTAEGLLAAILKERQRELFAEFGHRWFDLKRTGHLEQVMPVVTPLKGGKWQSYQRLFPVPARELVYDTNLDQNPGY